MASSAAGRQPSYAIVLSTYQGAGHVGEQIASIRAQTAADWRLYVRDDGSRDETPAILRRNAARDPRIEVIPADGRNLGPAASFGVLLQHALDRGHRHVFLCDQDDIWLPEKCARLLAVMAGREAEAGEGAPLLVHSDLRVVGPALEAIHPSFMALQRIDANEAGRHLRVLVGNSVTGCASLVNAALLARALPIPEVAMHDWWLAQCAAAFGETLFVDEATVLYRQHGANVVGARGLSARAATVLRSPGAWWAESARRFLAGLRQLWVIRSRARARGLAMNAPVGAAIETLWSGLGDEPATLRSRLAASVRSGALPRSAPMRGLFLARAALLPWLRVRFGDERLGIREAGGAVGPREAPT